MVRARTSPANCNGARGGDPPPLVPTTRIILALTNPLRRRTEVLVARVRLPLEALSADGDPESDAALVEDRPS